MISMHWRFIFFIPAPNKFNFVFLIVLPCIGLLVWLVIKLIFYLTHRRPLTDKEIRKLMVKRQKKFIKKTFVFHNTDTAPDKTFKSKLKPSGRMYSANIAVGSFPSYAANLLKGKKHEWVVLACAQDDTVKYFYANKGDDNQSVSFNIEVEGLIGFCKRNGCQTILRFHNHPNEDPAHQTCLLASTQDKKSAYDISKIVTSYGINWLDFVCERGQFIEFARFFSPTFFPTNATYEYICFQNKDSRNYSKLHRELGVFR